MNPEPGFQSGPWDSVDADLMAPRLLVTKSSGGGSEKEKPRDHPRNPRARNSYDKEVVAKAYWMAPLLLVTKSSPPSGGLRKRKRKYTVTKLYKGEGDLVTNNRSTKSRCFYWHLKSLLQRNVCVGRSVAVFFIWVCKCSVLKRWAGALFRPTPLVYYCTVHLYSK